MPSEQRLHPATLLFDLAKNVKQFAVPALLVIVGASRSSGGPGGMFGRVPDGWEAWLLVLFVPAAIVSVARYLSFRLRYDDDELVIRSGLVFRNERNIPFSRIQNVDAIQNVFHRLFGVVEIRVETGGGKEEEARLSVLPRSAFDEMRRHVFQGRSPEQMRGAPLSTRRAPLLGAPEEDVTGEDATRGAPRSTRGAPLYGAPEEDATRRAPLSDRRAPLYGAPDAPAETLVHLPLRELLLCGFLENRGMVLIGASFGILWEAGLIEELAERFFEGTGAAGRGFFRDLITALAEGGPLPLRRIAIALVAIPLLLLLIRVVSMIWAFVRLYDFRLTLVGEDLRSEYGLFTRVTATVPIRRVQAITISSGPLHRWLERATVKVATAGGAGTKSAANVREWLAPLIRREALPHLLQRVVPGFDLDTVTWQPVHPRAFARAVKPMLIFSAIATLITSLVIGWGAIGVAIVMLLWSIVSARQYVVHLGWAEGEEVVMMKSGWIWQQITLARVNKIQAVTTYESPFDRRAAMAGVRVDTAGAGEFSHRVDIPYLDRHVARALAARLSAYAANTAFRW